MAERGGHIWLNNAKSTNDFSPETTGKILMKHVHNDHLHVGVVIKIITYNGFTHTHTPVTEGRGKTNAQSFNDFSYEATGQISMKHVINDHLRLEIRIHT